MATLNRPYTEAKEAPMRDESSTAESGVCDWCAGTLMTEAHRYKGRQVVDPAPCRFCLSVTATEEIQRKAREWLGTDLWYTPDDGFDEWEDGHGCPVVPLYLPAGRDLGVRVLAGRSGFTSEAIVFQPAPAIGGWLLIGHPDWRRMPIPDKEQRAFCAEPDFESWGAYPALATIPTDAPPDLRAARALALCLAPEVK